MPEVDQEPHRDGRDRGAERQAGGDEAEHLAHLAGRAGLLQHHVTRRARRAEAKPRGQRHGREEPQRHRHEAQRQDQRDGTEGQRDHEAEQVGVALVRDPAAHQRAERRPRHVARERERGGGDRGGPQLAEHGDEEGRDRAARHRREQEEGEEGEDGP